MPAVTGQGLEVLCAARWPLSILVHECGENELWHGQGVLVVKITPFYFLLTYFKPPNHKMKFTQTSKPLAKTQQMNTS